MFYGLILRNIIKGRSMLKSADKRKENGKCERRNILHSVCLYASRKNLIRSEIRRIQA